MKNSGLLIVGVLLAAAGALALVRNYRTAPTDEVAARTTEHPVVAQSHSTARRVPAYQTVEQVHKLGPTLSPSKFSGKTREAYVAAQSIPTTLAQLPCYCHCDLSFGHKSLHTCFEDDHAAHCAVCVDEALLAYRLQMEEKLTPEQVREKIIARYSNQ